MIKLLISVSLLAASITAYAGGYKLMGFTKGNKCAQMKNYQGKMENYCRDDGVSVHTKSNFGMSSKVRILQVSEEGCILVNGNISRFNPPKFFSYGSFSVKK